MESRIDPRSVLLAIMASLLASFPVHGQKLSDRTITIIVPYTPGTGVDSIGRLVAQEIQKRWGQSVVVENKPGASGNIGTQQAARATPDGHTMLFTTTTHVMNVPLYKSLPYDPQASFVPIVEVARGAMVLTVHPSLGVTSLAELVTKAKAEPGRINYASPGRGTPHHMSMELLKVTTGTSVVHVPYTGSAGALKDLAGGHVSAMFMPLQVALPLAEDGQLRMLALGSLTRSPLAPEVPTLAELGYKDFDVDLWYGLLGPQGLPADITQRYNALINEILAAPEIREAFLKQGVVARGGTAADFGKLLANDQVRWTRVVKDAGISAE